MKKIILSLSAASIILSVGYAGMKKKFWSAEFMKMKEVCSRWGEQPLDEAKFKAAGDNRSTRAEMACSLLKNQKKYKGKSINQIKQIFGPPDGWFFNEAFSAYLINKPEKKGDDVWQILFLIDRHRNMSKIVVHKNCC